MDLMKNLLWVYPALGMTVFTLLTAVVAWTLRLGSSMPFPMACHAMCFMLNPKDDKLYQRPSVLAVLGFLLAGAIPVVCALMALLHLAAMALLVAEYVRQARKKRQAAA